MFFYIFIVGLILLVSIAIFFNKFTVKEPFQITALQNPITIADMATSVFTPNMIQITFPSNLTGNLNNTPIVKFNSDMTSNIKSALSIVGIDKINIMYVGNSQYYSPNITRTNEGSYLFLFDSLIDGTYQFNVTTTGQNLSSEPFVSFNLFIEQLNQNAPSNIFAYSKTAIPSGGGGATCSLNLLKSITANQPLNIRLTANSTLDIRLLYLSISVLRIN